MNSIRSLANRTFSYQRFNNDGEERTRQYKEPDPLAACRAGNTEWVKEELTKDANLVYRQYRSGRTKKMIYPLAIAICEGHKEVVELLIKHNADVNSISKGEGHTPLMYAAANRRADLTTLLIEKGADVTVKDEEGFTALIIAANYGAFEVAELLIKYSTDVNQTTKKGSTPLCFAAEYGHVEIVKLLIAHNADVNHATIGGSTPLICAAQNGHVEIVKLLIEHNADVNHATIGGSTPLTYAADYGHIEIVKLLIEHNANVNHTTIYRSTALYFAAFYGHAQIVECLLDNGADPNISTVLLKLGKIKITESPLAAARFCASRKTIKAIKKAIKERDITTAPKIPWSNYRTFNNSTKPLLLSVDEHENNTA